MKTELLIKELLKKKGSSAWKRGVLEYAVEMLEAIDPCDLTEKNCKEAVLNGAMNFNEYSWGGCSLIYDYDIAKRLCTPSEYKRKKGGELNPNSREQWLDTQARALYQAYILIKSTIRELERMNVG